MMRSFFLIIGRLFDIILWPFKGLPLFISLCFIAIITGFLAVLIFKHLSNQDVLKRIINKIKLHFTEIILYRDDICQILIAQKEILKENFCYLIRTIKPAIPIVAIVLLILSQLNMRYSVQNISPGEPVTVKVLTSDFLSSEAIELRIPKGLEIVTPSFHHPGSKKIEWRIMGEKKGIFELGFKIGNKIYKKNIIIGPFSTLFSPHLGRQGFLETILNPIEELLPVDGPIQTIDIGYKSRSFKLGLLGIDVHWLVAFLVIAIFFGLIFRKLMKVS